jgi:aminocarboxymuconate-semialdehyde decarboxylase
MAAEAGRVVDIHCHVALPECEEWVRDRVRPEYDPFSYFAGAGSNDYNARHFSAIVPQLTEPSRRLEDMDRMGVDIQAISVAPPQYYYWTEPDLGARLTSRLNERIAEICRQHPERFVGLGTLPMQDSERAVRELRRVVEDYGFRGVEICTNVNGIDYDHPRFEPFFAAAEELGVLIVLHPHGFTHGLRLSDYYLTNIIGNPLDSTVAVTRMIFGGVLQRHPALHVCVVHGGGYLPFYWARMDHAWNARTDGRIHLQDRPPSQDLRRLYVDTVVFEPSLLATLVATMGPDHVLLGTDYPYDMGEENPVGLVEAVQGLSAEERALIVGGTATRLLGITETGKGVSAPSFGGRTN